MIRIDELSPAISRAEPLFPRLMDFYGHLPKTRCTCQDPGICCTFLPEMTVVEALHWIGLMREMPPSERTARIQGFVSFYLTNPARLEGCPFREEGSCAIYPYRTFGCRAYGLWSREMGRARTRKSRNSKKALRKMWKKFGVDIPAEPLEMEMDYCDKVQTQAGEPPGDGEIMDILTEIYHLGKSLGNLQSRFEEEYHSDFSFLVTSLLFGLKKTLLLKFGIIREIVREGTDRRLQEVLGQVSPKALRCL